MKRGPYPTSTTAEHLLGAVQRGLAQLSDAEWMQVKSAEDRRRAEQHSIRDLAKRYRELGKLNGES